MTGEAGFRFNFLPPPGGAAPRQAPAPCADSQPAEAAPEAREVFPRP